MIDIIIEEHIYNLLIIILNYLADLYTVKVPSPTSWQFKVTDKSQANQSILSFGGPSYPNDINTIVRALLLRKIIIIMYAAK